MSYHTTSEVEKLCGVDREELGDWERRVRLLRPLKDYSGYRQYSQRDIDIILRLKYLIRTKGYPVEKAGEQLEKEAMTAKKNIDTLNEIRKMRSDMSDSFFELRDLIKREGKS